MKGATVELIPHPPKDVLALAGACVDLAATGIIGAVYLIVAPQPLGLLHFLWVIPLLLWKMGVWIGIAEAI